MHNVETNGQAQERESMNVYVALAGSQLHARVDCGPVPARPAGSTYSWLPPRTPISRKDDKPGVP